VKTITPGETLEMEDDGSFKFQTRIWEGEDYRVGVSCRDMPFDCDVLSTVKQVKKGAGTARLVLNNDEHDGKFIEIEDELGLTSRDFVFPQEIGDASKIDGYSVKLSTPIVLDLRRNMTKKPFECTFHMERQKLMTVGGLCDGIGDDRSMILKADLTAPSTDGIQKEGGGDTYESDVVVHEDGSFVFPFTCIAHTHYKIGVKLQPDSQGAALQSFAGMVQWGRDVDNVKANITDNPWTIGGEGVRSVAICQDL
jgi:hypothetical protein